MAGTKKMSLAQALTYKGRVVEEINRLTGLVAKFNCVPVITKKDQHGNETRETCRQDVDINASVDRRNEMKSHLIALKLLMWESSEPIRRNILRLAECKDDITFLSGLKTDQGFVTLDEERFSYRETAAPKEMDSILTREKVEATIRAFKAQIDKIQAEIDEFNHTTRVEVEDIGL